MLDPLELQVFPSCYNCLSWSSDGELAVASGENVLILTPKPPSKRQENETSPLSSNDWHRTRFRANVFTINEWSIMFPQPRDRFSIGAEQSLSTVVGVEWSPPGLVKHRRSVLAVLTSNMVLSIYALVPGSGKWTRIAVVNKALEAYFGEGEESTSRARKSSIRAFTWIPPLKVPAQNQLYLGPDSRWGISFLAVTNDENDVVFLRVQGPSARQDSSESFRVEAISAVSLPDTASYDHLVQPSSMFASALRSQVRILTLASGPWLFEQQESEMNGDLRASATVNIAAVQGTKLQFVRLNVRLHWQADSADEELRYGLTYDAVENTGLSVTQTEDVQFTGPICWTHETGSGRISLAAGAVAGLVCFEIPECTYRARNSQDSKTNADYYPLTPVSTDAATSETLGHLERISGMTIAIVPEKNNAMLHLGTVGGYAAIKPLKNSAGADRPSHAPWSHQIDDLREQFDIDRDLGGLAISRVWGLASTQGLIAAAVTLHPGDMIEYRTNAEDRVTIVFSTADGQELNVEEVPLLSGRPPTTIEFMRERSEVVLRYILREVANTGARRALSPKVLYAAACCAIVQSESVELLANAHRVLKTLAATSGVDMADEMAKCAAPGSAIEAKPARILNAIGGDMFEKCEVCEAGIGWYSAQEAQCATGHIFGARRIKVLL
ncbi:transcription factor IIIC subunit delta N-term-domain-containing protein [Aspergillus karnatakaensis]|uniref:uncharacterized protein n=1 Tax=Aspergillus karnatakaensis TaxID=1810916 RepID=UPI003CCD77F6